VTVCRASDLYLIPERNLAVDEWRLAYARLNSNQSGIGVEILQDEAEDRDSDALYLDTNSPAIKDLRLAESAVYWSAPRSYTGNKVASYGGRIDYSLRIRAPPGDNTAQAQMRPDLILVGQNMSLMHTSVRQPAVTTNDPFNNKIDLLESQFTHLLTGSSATRDQLMIVLSQLSEIKLRYVINKTIL
jgi:hypothetical protein